MKFFMVTLFFPFLLLANHHHHDESTIALANKLNLYGGAKATIQWERVFSSPRHLKKYHLNTLDISTRNQLKAYLIEHAADSDQPILPGL